MPKKNRPDSRLYETPASRIRFYLQKIWGGSQTKMAKDTGLSQGAISNVVRDKLPPGREFLLAVAAHPKVSPGWLLSGAGAAFSGPVRVPLSLPVAKTFLPGLPQKNAAQLTGETRPVPRSQYRKSRYWLELEPPDVATLPEGASIIVGDWVVIETSRHYWNETGWIKRERTCVFRSAVQHHPLLLGLVDLSGRIHFRHDSMMSEAVPAKTASPFWRPFRRLDVSDDGVKATEQVHAAPDESYRADLFQIVGVIVSFSREFD